MGVLNPFTGQEHFDIIDYDKFLKQSSKAYDAIKYELLDNTHILNLKH